MGPRGIGLDTRGISEIHLPGYYRAILGMAARNYLFFNLFCKEKKEKIYFIYLYVEFIIATEIICFLYKHTWILLSKGMSV